MNKFHYRQNTEWGEGKHVVTKYAVGCNLIYVIKGFYSYDETKKASIFLNYETTYYNMR